jgi:hypothetical protein
MLAVRRLVEQEPEKRLGALIFYEERQQEALLLALFA